MLGFVTVVHAASVSGQGTWETTLQGRDLDGNLSTFEAYYDTVLDITWLANANYAQTSGFDADGWMTWTAANAWAAGLNINGYTGWRLPTVSPVDGTTADDANVSYIGTEDRGYNISAPGTLYAGSTASEMAHMFHNTLGDKGYCNPATSTVSTCSGPQAGYGLSNSGPFSNLLPDLRYWSATEYAPSTSFAWFFSFTNGEQRGVVKADTYIAWAVHSGDVGASTVPVPAAVWLFGSGLLGLIGMARRKTA
jgi:hypothetical protein